MDQFIIFLYKASVYLLLFSLAYLVLFRSSLNHGFNRAYLLLASVASVMLALIPYGTFQLNDNAGALSTITVQLPEVVLQAPGNISESGHLIGDVVSRSSLIPMVYVGVVMLFLLIFAIKLIWLAMLLHRHPHSKHEGLSLVMLPDAFTPFSFYKWIFIPASLNQNPHLNKVLAHERAHFDKRHTLDVIFYEMLKIIFWFHPAVYFIAREARTLHEYEADKLALRYFEKKEYQQTLLECALAGKAVSITNPFNVSPIKKRIMKMNQMTKTGNWMNWLSLCLLLPVIGMVVLLQACQFEKPEVDTPVADPAIDQTEIVVEQTVEDEKPLFTMVEVMPEYPGGVEAMMAFIGQNITYPAQAKRNGIEGRVFINFVVEIDGSVSNVNVLRGIGGGCDEEAVRVVEMMPKWTPGYQRGEAVRVSFNLPVKFELQD